MCSFLGSQRGWVCIAEMLAGDLVPETMSILLLEVVAYDVPLAGTPVRTPGHWWQVAKKHGEKS